MSTTTIVSYTQRIIDEAEARTEARSILRVLDARGFAVTEEVRGRIASCTDSEQLATLTYRAATITDLDDLFG